ncbi:MAG: glycosyl hydrolase family 18 protein [Ignavibacteria bacterium]|nr:glycosyl hydrolase family 18 protein [Ignavibacteria bacterium]
MVKHIESTGSAKLITTLVYAFIEPAPNEKGNIETRFMNDYIDYQQPYSELMSVDGKADDPAQPLRGQFNQLRKLKKLHPKLKIVISIGGWLGSVYFSDAVRTPEARAYFIHDCIDKFILGNLPVKNGAGGKAVAAGIFDGFDLDWEYPIDGGVEGEHHNKNDRENFSLLIKEFRTQLQKIKPHGLLTCALSARITDLYKFNGRVDQQYVDWFNMMTYDYHGGWDKQADHHTNLLSGINDINSAGAKESLDRTVRYFRDSCGVSPNKIIPGAAFYGRGWKDVAKTNNGLFQAGSIAPGLYEAGFNYYADLTKLMKNGYSYFWDEASLAPYLYSEKEKTFWSFDDPRSIALKTRYAEAYKLRGFVFWEITGDNADGELVRTIADRNMPSAMKTHKRNSALQVNPEYQLIVGKTSIAYRTGSIVPLTLKVNQDGATIQQAEFFCDGKSLGFVTSAPFTWALFNAQPGMHVLYAVVSFGREKPVKTPDVKLQILDN